MWIMTNCGLEMGLCNIGILEETKFYDAQRLCQKNMGNQVVEKYQTKNINFPESRSAVYLYSSLALVLTRQGVHYRDLTTY